MINSKTDKLLANLQEEDAFVIEFQNVCSSFIDLVMAEGVTIRPNHPDLPYFRKMDAKKKKWAVESIKFQYELCSEQMAEGYSLKDNPSFTWRALNKLGLIPRSDFFGAMSDNHIVEVYSVDHLQLYRSFKFYELCSYTLEDLHSREWFDLYHRDHESATMCLDVVNKVCQGEITESFIPDIPTHIVTEKDTDEKNALNYKIELISPLTSNKRTEGFILLLNATLV